MGSCNPAPRPYRGTKSPEAFVAEIGNIWIGLIEQIAPDPSQHEALAAYFGVEPGVIRDWIEVRGRTRCSGTASRGRRCANIVGLYVEYDPRKWAAERLWCVSHDRDRNVPFTPPQRSVLVAEDEALIRWMVSDALRDAGCQVIEAVDGDEAVSIIQAGVTPDLVFSDVNMPGAVDGLALLDFIQVTDPSIPVFVTSGHCDPMYVKGRGASNFLPKPYDVTVVVDLILKELDAGRGPR